MPYLDVTAEQIAEQMAAVYGKGQEHAPAQLFVCPFHDYHTHVRASFPTCFCAECASRLHVLVHRLRKLHCPSCEITIVISIETLDEGEVWTRTALLNSRI